MTALKLRSEPSLSERARILFQKSVGRACLAVGSLGGGWPVRHSQKAAVSVEDWVSQLAPDPDSVRRLCNTPNAMTGLRTAVDIACRAFPVGSPVTLRVEQDPESEEECVVVDVAVQKGGPSVALNC